MEYCDTDFVAGKERLQCLTHGGDARHVATNGDDIVCEKYARLFGCNCCKENGKKRDRPNVKLGDKIVVGERVFELIYAQDGIIGFLEVTE